MCGSSNEHLFLCPSNFKSFLLWWCGAATFLLWRAPMRGEIFSVRFWEERLLLHVPTPSALVADRRGSGQVLSITLLTIHLMSGSMICRKAYGYLLFLWNPTLSAMIGELLTYYYWGYVEKLNDRWLARSCTYPLQTDFLMADLRRPTMMWCTIMPSSFLLLLWTIRISHSFSFILWSVILIETDVSETSLALSNLPIVLCQLYK